MSTLSNPDDHLPRRLDAGEDGSRGPAILLVDDHPFALATEALLLASMGYRRIGTAASAEAALRLMRADPSAVDVLICDLNMPGMDGIEFLRILDSEGFEGGVILLSGEGERVLQTVQRLLGHGRLALLGALQKPASRERLDELLAGWAPAAPEPAPFSEDELRTAHDRGQWVLHYQPKVSLRDGSLASLEALIRWAHPEQGLVMPNRFIELAETSGLIVGMTEWILREALAQIARWQGAGLHTRVALNVSMLSLDAPDFASRVGEIVREASMRPEDLILEITESRLIAPSATPLENLVRLRVQRFGLSIDDFGTGHSSLAQLRDIPFTELKVDRGFVRGARSNPVTRPLLEGSIEIAKGLGMQSVAEGVETEDDWRLLQEVGCDLAQGYFVGRPMPAEQVGGWLQAWAARRGGLAQPAS
ncbi:EAL domain-containing response regulator [Variovorax saccharolyticus]|uniref:EAL domain-containing response regulator n=1 Tax=Variovorax saccharolyticus TaxID=3053516 RepID=UPI002578AF48|nr:EAL domain-containing response regulator [Variovorax sp. J31P216]MDM0028957.1 EAL domain-containing response regulator [Variovorax sp. J31P216]